MAEMRARPAASMKIPKRIHQIWIQGEESLPEIYRTPSKTWRNNNPGWNYTLWNDEALRELMAGDAPEWLRLYDLQPEMSAKADVGRYALLQVCGGLYADMDTECVRPVAGMMDRGSPSIFCQIYDRPWPWVRFLAVQYERIVNSVIASAPGNPIWNKVRVEIENKPSSWFVPFRTGPGMFWPVVKSYAENHPQDVAFWDHREILTAFYLPRAYMRWYASLRREIRVLDFNDAGRAFLLHALNRPHQVLAGAAKGRRSRRGKASPAPTEKG